MRTFLPQVERRVVNRPNQSFGVLAFDLDNAYPQKVLEMAAASPTAIDCWDKRTKYITGKGFEEVKFGEQIINKKGLTIAKLHRSISKDKALFKCFALHINYNANFSIASVHYVRYEDVRIGDTDNPETRGKLALYNDWGRKTWKSIQRRNIKFVNRYNPDPEVIKNEVIDAGGWREYKGQVLYFGEEIEDYTLAKCDCVLEDIETEAGIKTFNNRTVTTGFLPAALLFMKSRREQSDNKDSDEGSGQPDDIERNLGIFQGAKNGQKIMVIEYEEDDSKPDLQTFPIQNNDKLFEVTEKSVEKRIIKGFSVPPELISNEKSSGLSNGGEKKEAIKEFNDNTSDDRKSISEVFSDIFSRFHANVNPSGNYNILECPTEAIDDNLGAKAGRSINELLLSDLPAETKINVLISVYGLTKIEADAIVNGTEL